MTLSIGLQANTMNAKIWSLSRIRRITFIKSHNIFFFLLFFYDETYLMYMTKNLVFFAPWTLKTLSLIFVCDGSLLFPTFSSNWNQFGKLGTGIDMYSLYSCWLLSIKSDTCNSILVNNILILWQQTEIWNLQQFGHCVYSVYAVAVGESVSKDSIHIRFKVQILQISM